MGLWKKMREMGVRPPRPNAGGGSGIQINVKTEGVEDLIEVLEKLPPKVAMRPLKQTLKRAAKPLEQEAKNTLPVKLSDLKQAITTKVMRSIPAVKTGVYTKRVVVMLPHKGKEIEWDAYYLLYWHNYGTLYRRDPNHYFQKPVNIRKEHLSGGINPKKFIQKAYDNRFAEVVAYAEAHLLADAEKFLDRNSKRFIQKQVV